MKKIFYTLLFLTSLFSQKTSQNGLELDKLVDFSISIGQLNEVAEDIGLSKRKILETVQLKLKENKTPANKNKKADFILCDTFTGVANASEKDSFFRGNEYSDANIDNIKNLEIKTNKKFEIVCGNFPDSMKNIKIMKPISFAHIDVDTYISAKESFYFIASKSKKGAVIVLDDYGGWFTDGATKFGNELKKDKDYFVVPNHLGQLIIYKL